VYSSLYKARKAFWLTALSSAAFTLSLLGGFSGLLGQDAAIAQQVSPQLRQAFLSNPLTAEQRDPLLPAITVDRSFSPLELRAIDQNLDQLNQTALEQLAAGQTDSAFALLLREVRLRRVFGPVAEFNALREVATLAWNQQRPVEVQLLTLRSREIWQTVRSALSNFAADASAELGDTSPEELAGNPEQVLISGDVDSDVAVLSAIAQTFTTLRDIDSTVEVYQQLIAQRTGRAALRLVSVC
jgi:hypothetical protein